MYLAVQLRSASNGAVTASSALPLASTAARTADRQRRSRSARYAATRLSFDPKRLYSVRLVTPECPAIRSTPTAVMPRS